MRRGDTTTSWTRGARGNGMERGMPRDNSAMRGGGAHRWEVAARGEVMQQPAGQEGGDATTSRTRDPRDLEWEATAQHGERPCNINERWQSSRKMQQSTMGGRGNGGWQSQSHRLMGDNATTSQGIGE
jgi:hypothetical protein